MSVSRSIATILGAAALGGCGAGEPAEDAVAPDGLEGWIPERASEGAALFSEVGCLGCHTYAGEGSQNAGAPDLTAIGETDRGARRYAEHLREPAGDHPSFASLGEEQLLALGEFLDASRGC